MIFSAAEPPFDRFSASGDEWDGLEEQVQRFAQRYRGQVAQLSPPQLAAALQELAELMQALALAVRVAGSSGGSGAEQGIPAAAKPAAWAEVAASWKDLERAISLQSQLLFFLLELQSLPGASLGEPAAETPHQRLDPLAAACAEPELRPFRQFLGRLLQQRGHQRAEPLERLLHQQRLTGRLAWRQLWQVTLSLLEGQGVALPERTPPGWSEQEPANTLAQLQGLQAHASAEIRWAAYQRLCQHLEAHADLGGFILSTLIRDHLWEAQWRGYDSAADLYLARHGLDQTFWENLLEGIRDRMDLFQRYYRLKSRKMGRSIRICDLYAPWGGPVPSLTAAEAASFIWAALQDFCPECAAQAKPWLAEITSELEADEPARPGKTEPSGGGEPLLQALAALSRRLRPEDPLVWLDLEELQGAAQPAWEVQMHTAFLQQMLLDHLVATGGAAQRLRERPGNLKLAQTLLIRYLETQLQAVFYQSLIGRLELLLYRSGIPELENGATYPLWVSEEWLKLCQELCGDAVELLREHQFYWLGMPELFLRPFSAHQASLASLVALACCRQYHLSPRTFLPRYLSWLASLPGSLTWEESAQMLQVELSNPEAVLQGLEELEHWIETLEKLLEEEPD